MASPDDFAPVAAYLGAAVGKPMAPEQVEVYYDLLGRLPSVVLWEAVREVLRHHLYPTLPTAGAIYEVACRLLARQRDREAQDCRLAADAARRPLLSTELRERLGLALIGRMPGEAPKRLPGGNGEAQPP